MLKCQNWNTTLQILTPNVGPNTREIIVECIQLHLTTLMTLGFRRALTLLGTHSHKLGVRGSIMASSPKYEDMQGMYRKSNRGLLSLMTCSAYEVICEKYDDLLDMHDNVYSNVHQEG